MMQALELTTQDRNSSRQELFRVLPLNIPFSISMSVSNVCNFRCNYCVQSQYNDGYFFDRKIMQLTVYERCIDHILASGRLKTLFLAGYGEPLLNQDIVRMVQYAKDTNVADTIEIITNGVGLTPELSDQLVAAGLSRIRISLQGLTDKEYFNICGYRMEYEKFIENLEYLYNHRQKLQIYIKIMDIMVKEEEKKQRFTSTFSHLCDQIAIESLIPLVKEMDYTANESSFKNSFYGEELVDYKICSSPFYSCVVDYDGSVVPCCVVPYWTKFGNLSEVPLAQIWGKQKHTAFLLKLLEGQASELPTCRDCIRYKFMMLPKDRLDGHEDMLISKYKA